jgi:hypothetical protein
VIQAFDHAACLAEYCAAVNARIEKYLAESKAASGSGGGGGGGRVRSAGLCVWYSTVDLNHVGSRDH